MKPGKVIFAPAAVAGAALTSDGTPFPEMPKLHVVLGELTQEVFDAGRAVAFREIQVHRRGRDIQIRVPRPMLRQPQKVFASTQMHEGPVPLDWTSWRILEIGAATAPAA